MPFVAVKTRRLMLRPPLSSLASPKAGGILTLRFVGWALFADGKAQRKLHIDAASKHPASPAPRSAR